MGRRELREQIFKLVFRLEFNDPEEMAQQCEMFFEDEDNACDEKEREYISTKFTNIHEKLSAIDEEIEKTAQGWRLNRMGKVELAIIRLAVFEIRYDEDVPESVAINEAVELAKKFGQEEAAGFVNGVLAKFVK